MNEMTLRIEVAPTELGEGLAAMRLCTPEAQRQMEASISQLGQLTPVQVWRSSERLEIFDGFKRVRAARQLSLPRVRAEVHQLDAAGAKVRLLRCNAGQALTEMEEAWLVRSLYRIDKLSQPQIAVLLSRHKSWVCRRLMLAEELSDEVTADIRLGLVSATSATELVRLQRCNQDEAAQAVTRYGLTSRQTARLVDELLAAPDGRARERVLRAAAGGQTTPVEKTTSQRRTPGEQLVADAWAMKRLAARLHARLLERSLESLGAPACFAVARELVELRGALDALATTLGKRLATQGVADATR